MMKYAMLLCLILLSTGYIQAQESIIPLSITVNCEGSPLKNKIRTDRSLSSPLYATYEHHNVSIYADKTIEYIRIIIEDTDGNCIISEEISQILSGERYIIRLNAEPGNYTLNIYTSDFIYI